MYFFDEIPLVLLIYITETQIPLTLSRRRCQLYRNQSTDFESKSMDWFLYNRDLRHEKVKEKLLPKIIKATLQCISVFRPLSNI